ncbi:hypothetical protein JD844_023470 [Phrynosoma platyrhinos]|uniref:Protein FAM161A n=1 Tax=Phrynosoma platyrhinos TaxID=52577 RepID=A0ABQ7SWQ5_PHRPL|nr:hypothetical protein JD844_023470 [Phrynosoma platyrhinos]
MPENLSARGAPANAGNRSSGGNRGSYQDRDKPTQIRFSNISAGKAVADAVRTSLGPKGMDKMLVELSKAQDIEAGDGTTSVVVIAGALLDACSRLLQKGIHPTIISESFQKALEKGVEVLTSMGQPVELSDRETLLNSATTALNSKVVSQYSSLLSPMSVDAVMKVIDPNTATGVDLRDIKIVKKLGGTIDDCELVEGLVLTQKVSNTGVTRVEKAKIGLIQFCLSAPKTDAIFTLPTCFEDALSDLALHFLNKMKIMVIKDIEREDIEFICKVRWGYDSCNSIFVLQITGCTSPGKTVTIVVRGSNKLVIEEAERSIHDALCVIRCLVKKRALIAGGGAPEIELALRLNEYSRILSGMESYCVRAYGEALEIIPSTLAENAGLNPISTVTELRNRHAQGEKTAGINVRKGGISNILEELVVQPLLVSVSALTLATETVRSILKIDDVNSLNPEREQNSDVHTDFKDWIENSKMYLSNQEYYLKLEELKNAHLETMAKLENMYQNKLYLKGVQHLPDTDMSYRSTYGMNSLQNQKICSSFSEPNLNNSFHSNFSDTSDEQLDLDKDDSEEELTFQKEQIENVCDRSSSEDYSHYNKDISSILQTLQKTKRRKKKKWSPKITVPQPFQMTIREAKKKQQNIKSKSLIELENNLLKKQWEEEAECQKKFRANPVPAYVFVPLYHEIMQQNEEHRKSLRERRREILLAMQKPFKFIEREAQKKELRKAQLKDLSFPEKAKIFKAKPVPKFIYSSETSEKLKEEELYREIRIQMRSEELLRNSSLPSNRLGNKGASKHREQCCLDHTEELECKPKPKVQVPDFELLHKKFQKQLQRQKNVKHITVCDPFTLHTANIPSNKEKILEDIQMDEKKLKETRWPYASSRCSPQMRNLNTNLSPLCCEEPTLPRITESTRRRLQAIRDSAEEKRKMAEEQKRRRVKQKHRARELQRLISTRAEANDPHQSLAQMYKLKLKTFRKHEKQRMREYLQELEEMEERVEKRPLLLEQATQKNARIAAEKHYSDILRELGLREEFVSEKGQPAAEKLLQGHSSDGSEILAAADIRSDNEDKTEDKESQGEEKKSQIQCFQSYEEEDDDDEEEEEEEEEEKKEQAEEEDGETQSDHDDQDAPEYENENYEQDSVEKSSDDKN